MALVDVLLRFANALAITATGNATNVIDMIAAASQMNGKPMQVVIKVDVAADATQADETYAFSLVTDDNAALASAATVATRTISRSLLTLNSLHTIDIPENVSIERYLGLTATLGGTTPSITYTAWIAEKGSLTNLIKYPNGYDA